MERLLSALRLVRRPGDQDWAGRCAFVLALGLASGWGGSLLLVAVQGGPLSESSASLLATLGGAMAGAVATYLGSTVHQLEPPAAAPPKD